MVSNTIGLTVLEDEPNADTPARTIADCSDEKGSSNRDNADRTRKIKQATYFWNTDMTGNPQPIFTIEPQISCPADEQRVWPIAGLSILLTLTSRNSNNNDNDNNKNTEASSVRLAILAYVVCLNAKTAESLQFGNYETAVIVVENPYESPHSWRYTYKLFPPAKSGKYKW